MSFSKWQKLMAKRMGNAVFSFAEDKSQCKGRFRVVEKTPGNGHFVSASEHRARLGAGRIPF